MVKKKIIVKEFNTSNLLSYQIPHVKTLLEAILNNRRVLDASDTGTGKTYTTCSIIKNLELPFGIICTKASRGAWIKAMTLHGLKPEFLETYEMLRDRETPFTRYVTLENNKKRFEMTLPKQFVVGIDECHRSKGIGTFNSRLMKRVAQCGCFAVALSATPATNPLEMDALGCFLGLHNEVSFYSWAKKHGCAPGPFRGLVYYGKKDYMKIIHDQIFPKLGARMRVAEIPDFPESIVQFTPVVVENHPDYDQILSECTIDFMERGIKSGEHLAALVEYRQQMEMEKVPLIVEMARDLVEQGYSVPIFVNFKAPCEAIQKELSCCEISGRISESKRNDYEKGFQDDSFHTMVLTAGSGGESISLHDINGKRPRAPLICPMYSAIRYRQILGRAARAGGKSKVIQKIIYALNTREENVCYNLKEKLDRLDLLTDGDLANIDPLTFKQWKERQHANSNTDSTTTTDSCASIPV